MHLLMYLQTSLKQNSFDVFFVHPKLVWIAGFSAEMVDKLLQLPIKYISCGNVTLMLRLQKIERLSKSTSWHLINDFFFIQGGEKQVFFSHYYYFHIFCRYFNFKMSDVTMNFNTYHISSNKRPRCLWNFETVTCGAY